MIYSMLRRAQMTSMGERKAQVDRYPHAAECDSPRAPRYPIVYALLTAPYGAVAGYLTVALAYAVAHSGTGATTIGFLIALFGVAQACGWLWAPLLDSMLGPKRWYAISAAAGALGVLAMTKFALSPNDVAKLAVAVFASSAAVCVLYVSAGALVANTVSDANKGWAGGWLQAGTLGGQCLGGGAALWLSERVTDRWTTAASVAAFVVACCVALPFISAPRTTHAATPLKQRLAEVAQDVWAIARSRRGSLALLLLFLPFGTGAASNLWAVVAQDWHATAGTVALVNGPAGGLVSALGCLLGGHLCDRFERRATYIAFGACQAVCAGLMALAPRNESAYTVFTILYLFTVGLTYAGSSAIILEVMGCKSAATKYSIFLSLSTASIASMTALESAAHARWGSSALLYTEAALAMASVIVFGITIAVSSGQPAKSSAQPALT
jgi:MFS transporter, PAT family, beta-lactamase induction signal transducer AmpG